MPKRAAVARQTSASPDSVCSRTCLPANPRQWQSAFSRCHSKPPKRPPTDSLRVLEVWSSWLPAPRPASPRASPPPAGPPIYEYSSSSLSSFLPTLFLLRILPTPGPVFQSTRAGRHTLSDGRHGQVFLVSTGETWPLGRVHLTQDLRSIRPRHGKNKQMDMISL